MGFFKPTWKKILAAFILALIFTPSIIQIVFSSEDIWYQELFLGAFILFLLFYSTLSSYSFLINRWEKKTKKEITLWELLKRYWWKIALSFLLSPYIVEVIRSHLPFESFLYSLCSGGRSIFAFLQSCLAGGLNASLWSIFLAGAFLFISFNKLSLLLEILPVNTDNPFGRMPFEFSRIGFQALLLYSAVALITYVLLFSFAPYLIKKLKE